MSSSSPSTAAEMYQWRVDTGYYLDLVADLNERGKSLLASCEYGAEKDFIRRKGWAGGYTYSSTIKGRDNKDFKCIVFGEVATTDEGTRLSALGGHWPGNMKFGNNYITNKTMCKDIVVLRLPTQAEQVEELVDLYGDQFVPLYEAKNADWDADEEDGRTFETKFCVLNADADNPFKRLVTHFPPKYMGSGGAKTSFGSNGTVRAKDRRKALADTPRPSESADMPAPPYRVGQLYDPKHLPDYGGVLFKQHSNRLVQYDVRDLHGQVVPPWQMYDVLKPGTLVVASVTPSVYVITDDRDSQKVDGEPRDVGTRRPKSEKKVYHLSINSIRVVAESLEDAEPRFRHPGFSSTSVDVGDTKDSDELTTDIGEIRPLKRARPSSPAPPTASTSSKKASGKQPAIPSAVEKANASESELSEDEDMDL